MSVCVGPSDGDDFVLRSYGLGFKPGGSQFEACSFPMVSCHRATLLFSSGDARRDRIEPLGSLGDQRPKSCLKDIKAVGLVVSEVALYRSTGKSLVDRETCLCAEQILQCP